MPPPISTLWETLCARGVRQGPFCRSLGAVGSREQIGCGFMKKPAGVDHRFYTPPFYSLSYVVSGYGHYENHHSGQLYELSPGSIFTRSPKISHTTTIKEGPTWIETFINCGPQLANALELCGTITCDPPCLFLGSSDIWLEAFIDLNQMSFHLSDDQHQDYLLRCCSLLEKIFTSLRVTEAGSDQQWIQMACIELSKGFKTPQDIKTLCLQKGWDYDSFRKKFKKFVGVSPSQYRINRRIDRAKEILMTHPSLKLADCADQLGYSSVYEFCNQFKKITGYPAGHFKRGKVPNK